MQLPLPGSARLARRDAELAYVRSWPMVGSHQGPVYGVDCFDSNRHTKARRLSVAWTYTLEGKRHRNLQRKSYSACFPCCILSAYEFRSGSATVA